MFGRFHHRKEKKKAEELLSKAAQYAAIANTTVNPTVFFSSISMTLNVLEELTQYEKFDFFVNSIPSNDFVKIVSNIGISVDNFVDRALQEIENSSLRYVAPQEVTRARLEFITNMLSEINTESAVWKSKTDPTKDGIKLYTAANLMRIKSLYNFDCADKPQNKISRHISIWDKIDAMDGSSFEAWCAELLQRIGFCNILISGKSGDQGVDILAEKEDIKYAIQCKCYSSDLGNTPIQEVYAGKMFYNCHVGAVMTNRHFTDGGRQLASSTGVLLWDRDWIQKKVAETDLCDESEDNNTTDLAWKDDMFPQAVDVILETGHASVSTIQRKLKLGYARAARIMDEMEEYGLVGPYQGSKPRAVLISKSQWASMKASWITNRF